MKKLTGLSDGKVSDITEDLTALLNEVCVEDVGDSDDERNGLKQSDVLPKLARRLSAVIVRTANDNHDLRQRVETLEAEGKNKDQILHGILKRVEDLERSSIIDLETGIYTERYLSQAADNFSAQFHRYNASFGVLGISVALAHVEDLQKQGVLRALGSKLSSSFRGCDQVIFSREECLFTILLNRVIQKDHMRSIAERVGAGVNDICEKSIPIGAFLMQAGQKEEEKGNVVHTAIRGMRQSLNMWHEGGNVAILLNGA